LDHVAHQADGRTILLGGVLDAQALTDAGDRVSESGHEGEEDDHF
jgi:hypothetical protein